MLMKNINYFFFSLLIIVFNSQAQNSNKQLYSDTSTYYSSKTTDLKCKGIPDSIFNMKSIKRFVVIGEDCDVVLHDEKGDIINMCCVLGEIPAAIGKLSNLEVLEVRLNGLDSLPKAILNCQKLRIIDLTDNNVTNIDNITALKNLEELYLFGCHLTKLPDNIGELKKLKTLGLTGNYRIEQTEITRIQKALPNCRVVFER